ncbi:MAG: hypothetical protein NUW01_18260 [Gemmatimonadaceae bacterium]|nr:hypothetical protein [Gemmatimonadaceae bacterium]
MNKIAGGEYRVAGPGMKPGKPVVVDASTGRWVEGSGRPANANDPAALGKQTAFKHSRVYQETLERLVPAMRTEGEYAVTSLEELLMAARRVTTDTTRKIEHECSECGHSDTLVVEGRPDAKVLTFLIERLVGAANKTTEVNLRSEELLRIVEDKRILVGLEVVGLTPEMLAERKRAVLEQA